MILEFFLVFFLNAQISNFIKSSQWNSLVQCGQTDGHDNVICRFRNFENVPENQLIFFLF